MQRLELTAQASPLGDTHVMNNPSSKREYAFSLFLFRYRILDVGLWSSRYDLPSTHEIMRTSLPDTQQIVRIYNT